MKRKILLVALAIAMMAAAVGCTKTEAPAAEPTTTEATTTENTKEAATEATGEVKTMDGKTLADIVSTKDRDGYMVVDVRPEEEYMAGHIPHAINILSDDMETELAQIEDWKDKPVILYCNSGKRSGEAAQVLVAAGFTDVTNAQGVKEYEYELVTYTDIRAEKMLDMVANEGAVLIDYRPAENYMEGHIEGAINIDIDTLADNLDKIPTDVPVIFYCNTGNKSSAGAKELSELGYTNVFNSIEGVKEYTFDLVTGE